MSGTTHLLVIDPQIDFCDPKGALSVPGADADMARLSAFVDGAGSKLDDIHVTLDSHQRLHIAHPEFVVDAKGNHPAPFTQITLAQVRAGEYSAANPDLRWELINYLTALEGNGRYPYVVWPPHCLIGSPGAAVHPTFMGALDRWVLSNFAVIDWVPKGSAWNTEHYSGVQADVIDPADPTTQLNKRLIDVLESAGRLFIAGEASSHCVANTVADIIDSFGDPTYASKITLITDCMSPVPGFEFLWDAFVAKYGSRINFMTSAEALRSL